MWQQNFWKLHWEKTHRIDEWKISSYTVITYEKSDRVWKNDE